MKKLVVLFVVFAAVLHGCKTDFEVNAPWKDITIVYGLLDQSDAQHFIKINKAFLGEVDVNIMAQIRDSSEYDPADINVAIEERTIDGTFENLWSLRDTTVTTKQGGVFYAPDQTLYYFDNLLNANNVYKLIITNKSGKVVTATTPLIGDFSFRPKNYWLNASNIKISFYQDDNYQTFNNAHWLTAKNGRRYQLTLRFHYREIDKSKPAPQDTLNLYIDWQFAAITAANVNGGDEIGVEIRGEDFYQFVANSLEPQSSSNNVERYIGKLDFIVDVAGEDLHTYIEVNKPSTGIVQEKPEYSNITNDKGNNEIGIFSCRHTVTIVGTSLSTAKTINSKTELCSGQYTWNLGFVNPGTCN